MPDNLQPRPRLLYKMRGLPDDPDGAREPHHHIYVLKVKTRVWLVCCYTAGRSAITRRQQQAWRAMQLPQQIGFPEIDLGRHVTFYHKATRGHRTVLDIASMRSQSLNDLKALQLHPSGEIDRAGHRQVLQKVDQYADWLEDNRPDFQIFGVAARNKLSSELARLAA